MFATRFQGVNNIKMTSMKATVAKTLIPFVLFVIMVYIIESLPVDNSIPWCVNKTLSAEISPNKNAYDRKGCIVVDEKKQSELRSSCFGKKVKTAPFA